MSNLKEFKQNFVQLIHNTLLIQLPNFTEKYYFLAEFLTVEY